MDFQLCFEGYFFATLFSHHVAALRSEGIVSAQLTGQFFHQLLLQIRTQISYRSEIITTFQLKPAINLYSAKPFSASQRSASRAAAQPVPAAVIA